MSLGAYRIYKQKCTKSRWLAYWCIHGDVQKKILPKSHSWCQCLFRLVVPPPLKNINRLGLLFPVDGKIKHVPNHQPVVVMSHMLPQVLFVLPRAAPGHISGLMETMGSKLNKEHGANLVLKDWQTPFPNSKIVVGKAMMRGRQKITDKSIRAW